VGEAESIQSQFPGDTARADTVATIMALDQAVGRILDKLEKTGLAKNTIVFFLSDNGGHPENRSENLPLNGYKWSVSEGGFRVPFFAVYPGVFPAGLVYDQPVMSFDILPTCAALAGVPVPGNLDGVDLTPYLKGEKQGVPHEALCWRIGSRWAIRKGGWKLESNTVKKPQLFAITEDFEERHDVAAAHPEVVEELQKAWQVWSSRLPSPLKRASSDTQKESE
jgi:arylsulfatase A-like enzyme